MLARLTHCGGAALVAIWCAAGAPAAAPDRAALERDLAARLTDCEFVGTFRMTRDLARQEPLGEPIPERYRIVSAVKDDGDWWIITARIQYLENDVQLPLRIQVLWSGDTPILTVDDLAVPGIGVYSARVMVYRNYYSGAWFGPNYGGILSGEIRKPQGSIAAASVQATPSNAAWARQLPTPVAILDAAGVQIVTAGQKKTVPNTAGATAFDWAFDPGHVIVARGGELARIAIADGRAARLDNGYDVIRTISCARSSRTRVFAADVGAERDAIWLLSGDDTSPTRLGGGRNPVLSADGKLVVYNPTIQSEPRLNLFHLDNRRHDAVVLPLPNSSPADETAAFSPDGRQLVRADAGALTLYALPDGKRIRQLTDGAAYDDLPSISADGRYCAFIRRNRTKDDSPQPGYVWVLDLQSGASSRMWETPATRVKFGPATP